MFFMTSLSRASLEDNPQLYPLLSAINGSQSLSQELPGLNYLCQHQIITTEEAQILSHTYENFSGLLRDEIGHPEEFIILHAHSKKILRTRLDSALPHSLCIGRDSIYMIEDHETELHIYDLSQTEDCLILQKSIPQITWPKTKEIQASEQLSLEKTFQEYYKQLACLAFLKNTSLHISHQIENRSCEVIASFPDLETPCSFRVNSKGELWVLPRQANVIGEGYSNVIKRVWSPSLGIHGAKCGIAKEKSKIIHELHENPSVAVIPILDICALPNKQYVSKAMKQCPHLSTQSKQNANKESVIMAIAQETMSSLVSKIFENQPLENPDKLVKSIANIILAYLSSVEQLKSRQLLHKDQHGENIMLYENRLCWIDLESIDKIGTPCVYLRALTEIRVHIDTLVKSMKGESSTKETLQRLSYNINWVKRYKNISYSEQIAPFKREISNFRR